VTGALAELGEGKHSSVSIPGDAVVYPTGSKIDQADLVGGRLRVRSLATGVCGRKPCIFGTLRRKMFSWWQSTVIFAFNRSQD